MELNDRGRERDTDRIFHNFAYSNGNCIKLCTIDMHVSFLWNFFPSHICNLSQSFSHHCLCLFLFKIDWNSFWAFSLHFFFRCIFNKIRTAFVNFFLNVACLLFFLTTFFPMNEFEHMCCCERNWIVAKNLKINFFSARKTKRKTQKNF